MQIKEKIKLGEILIQQKILTPLIVERIIRVANATHRRFGQTLEDLGLITGEEIAQALAIQLDHKIVTDICRFTIPLEVLRLVTEEIAFEMGVWPLPWPTPPILTLSVPSPRARTCGLSRSSPLPRTS